MSAPADIGTVSVLARRAHFERVAQEQGGDTSPGGTRIVRPKPVLPQPDAAVIDDGSTPVSSPIDIEGDRARSKEKDLWKTLSPRNWRRDAGVRSVSPPFSTSPRSSCESPRKSHNKEKKKKSRSDSTKKKRKKKRSKPKDPVKETANRVSQQCSSSEEDSEMSPRATDLDEISNTVSPLEWDAYRMWLVHVLGVPRDDVHTQRITRRMLCFLYFFRNGVDAADITAPNFYTLEDWSAQDRVPIESAPLLRVPISLGVLFEKDGDSVTAIRTTHKDQTTAMWWCTPVVDASGATTGTSALASPTISRGRRMSISHGSPIVPPLGSPLKSSAPHLQKASSLVSPRRKRSMSITPDMNVSTSFRGASPLRTMSPARAPSPDSGDSDLSDQSVSPQLSRVQSARRVFERERSDSETLSRTRLTSLSSSPSLRRSHAPGNPRNLPRQLSRSLPVEALTDHVDDVALLKETRVICHRKHTVKEKRREKKNSEKNEFMLMLMQDKRDPILMTQEADLLKKRDARLRWAIEWATSSEEDVPHHLRISACSVLSKLAYPVERISGLRELLWSSGAAPVLLNYARSEEFYVHRVIREEEIEFCKKIGEGAAGTVHLGVWDGADVAVKSCSSEETVGFELTEFLFEVALMCMMQHPNLLPCYGAFTEGPRYLLVSPFQENGSLETYLQRSDAPLTLNVKLDMLIAVASALRHMHAYDFIHRDLKSANVLLGADVTRDIYVTDFGTTRAIGKADKRATAAFVGTTAWMAPEMFERDAKQTTKVDVYSFGILMWELLTRSRPYSDVENWEIPDRVIAGERPLLLPVHYVPLQELKELYESMVAPAPKKRPAFDVILKRLNRLKSILDTHGKSPLRTRARSHSVSNLFG